MTCPVGLWVNRATCQTAPRDVSIPLENESMNFCPVSKPMHIQPVFAEYPVFTP